MQPLRLHAPPSPQGALAPEEAAEERRFFQERLAWLYGVLATLNAFLSFSSLPSWVSLRLPTDNAYALPFAKAMELAAVGGLVVLWLACSWGRWGRRMLTVLDVGGTMAVCALFAWISTLLNTRLSAFATMAFTLTYVLVGRAVVLPSTAARTLGIGVLATLMAGAVTVAVGFGTLSDRSPLTGLLLGFWVGAKPLLATTLLSTLASRVIYGLRRQVEQARRLGQYTLEQRIGEGGMGVVYRARHALLRRDTAVKVLQPGRMDAAALLRFEREVQLTARLTHPNTVAVFDYGRTPDGFFYYAMEYLDGGDLDDVVSLAGPLPAGRVVRILEQVCGALHEAHSEGLTHRDIKPANILLCERGRVGDMAKVVDFGLVKDAGEPGSGATGGPTGTPLYMSPEALTRPGEVDARGDLYALGAVGYFLLTGEPPFRGTTTVEVCAHHLYSPPVPPTQRLGRPVPPALEAVLLSCLEKEPARRPQSAEALRALLVACADVPPWTDEDAAAWWREHGPRLRAHRDTRRKGEAHRASGVSLLRVA